MLGRRDRVLASEERDANRPRSRGLGPFSGGQLTLIIVTLAIVVGFPAIASAVIPNGNTYNACALKTTGALRVIDTSKHQTCKSTETKLTWSKTGAAGAKGPKGATGAPGAAGASLGVALVLTNGGQQNSGHDITSYESTTPGIYCLGYTGHNPDKTGVLATPSRLNQTESTDRTAVVTFGAPTSGVCSGATRTDFTVTTEVDGVVAPSPFTVAVV